MNLQALVGHPIHIRVTREPFGQTFTFLLDNGYTEELEPDEARAWLKEHGVTDTLAIERALDDAWNFYETDIKIKCFSVPKAKHPQFQPQV